MLVLGVVLMVVGAMVGVFVYATTAATTLYWVAGALFIVGLILTIWTLRGPRRPVA